MPIDASLRLPFGQVAENAVVSRADNYAAYCSDYPSAVTPLLVSTAAGQEKTLSVGVNQTSRIVYLGDANLNQNGSLSTQANATGTVTTDFDRADGQSLGVDSGTGVSERMMRPAAVRRFSGTADRGERYKFQTIK